MSVLEVNAEKVVSDYLRAHPDVAAITDRVVGKTPSSTVAPWVLVRQLDAPSGGIPDHLVGFLLQLDCYAARDEEENDGQPGAAALYRAVRGALRDIAGKRSGAVATGAQIVSAPRIPDTDFEPARERFIITARVYLHP